MSKAIKHYGLSGLITYLFLKSGRTNELQLPHFRNTIRLRTNTDDRKLFKQLMFHREYEFRSSIRPEFIIDAGANIGLSALFFASMYPTSEIVAIEPETENFHLLCHNTRNYPNIKCIHAGLWSSSTTLQVTKSARTTTGFMVGKSSADDPNGVKGISTADILASYSKAFIDLFKMDIEGSEKEVLSENAEWLAKTKMLIIELHDRKNQGCSRAFFEALRHYNFECRPFGQNFLLINRDLI